MLSWAPSKDSTFFLVHNPKSITLFEPGKMRDSSIWIECLCCIFVRKLRIGIVYFLPLTSGQHEYIPLFFLSFIYLFYFFQGEGVIFLKRHCPQPVRCNRKTYSDRIIPSLFSVYVCVCVSKSWHRMAISSSDDAKKRKKYKKKMSYILLII